MSNKKGADDAALKIVRNNVIGLIRDLELDELYLVESFLHEMKQSASKAETYRIPSGDADRRGADRRRFQRIEMNLPIIVKPIKNPDARARVNTCDISGGGARFNIPDPGDMELGDHVELQMMLPDGQNVLKVQSRVVRISQDKSGAGCDVGIEFIYISSQDKRRIERFTGKIF